MSFPAGSPSVLPRVGIDTGCEEIPTHIPTTIFHRCQYRYFPLGIYAQRHTPNQFQSIWGETLTGGENVHGIKLSYAYKDWNFGIMVLDPFINNYKVKSENWNRYAGYYRETTTNMIKQLLTLDISWNINWGRKHEAGQQRINNSINSGSVNAAGK